MNKKIIIIGIVSIAIGILAGYFLFNNREGNLNADKSNNEHNHVSGEEQVYTCSMHPQIQQNEPGDCPICGMELIPLSDQSTNDNPLVFEMTEEAIKLSNIQTTVVGEGAASTDADLRLNGKLEADERQIASLTAHIPGRIEKLYVGFTGEFVRKGQRIARVYSPELITAQRELIEAKKIQDISPELLNAARNKLKYWKLPEATIKSILETEEIKEQFDIYADASGIVQVKRIQVGDHVMGGSVLFEVQNLYRLWAIFEVYERDLQSIQLGDEIKFTTPAQPDKVLKTSVNFIDPIIDKRTRIAKVRGEISNGGGQLKPEMFIEGQLIKKKKTDSNKQLMVPKSAVLWTGERSVVYVKLENTTIPSFEFKEVELGKRVGSDYEIKSGLSDGDEVVTNGAFYIDAAAQLNNRRSMMNRNVGIKSNNDGTQIDFTSRTPEDFQAQLNESLESYLKMKDALVNSDNTEAQRIVGDFNKSISSIDMTLLKGDAHLYWMEQENILKSHGNKLAESVDLEEQRKQFNHISTALIKVVKAFRSSDDSYYVQHCPMANNDLGADWISHESNILNPYFGDKMLKCGFITDTLSTNHILLNDANEHQNIHNH